MKFHLKQRSILFLFCLLPCFLFAQEICDNAIDDDGDGLIDFQDDDCECEFIEIRSLIANPSFEAMSCCPDQHYRLDCAEPWIQAYGTTPDYIHDCGWSGPDDIAVPRPFPDGEGIIGFANGQVRGNLPIEYDWKEYANTCLLGTMQEGVSYRIEFSLGFSSMLRSPPLELTIYGTSDCDNIPFGVGVPLPGCPTNFPEWVRLEGKVLSGSPDGPTWVNDFFEFTPDRDIRAISIGPPCEHFAGERTEYYFLDNLIMEETYLFQYQINESGDPCDDNFTLSVSTTAALAYQWYKNGIALVGETSPQLVVSYGDGDYQVRMIEADGCRMSPPYEYRRPITTETEVAATICEGGTYTDGSFSASAPGNYTYSLPPAVGCDSIINLTLKYCQIFLPNIFSPNRDGINDTFRVLEKDARDDYTIRIYNRWGGLVYEGLEWDGRVNGEPANMGVYIYYVSLTTPTGEQVVQQGSVTLIR